MSDENEQKRPAFPPRVNPRFVIAENVDGVDTNEFDEGKRGVPAFPQRARPRLAAKEDEPVTLDAANGAGENVDGPVLPPVEKTKSPVIRTRFGNVYAPPAEEDDEAEERISLDVGKNEEPAAFAVDLNVTQVEEDAVEETAERKPSSRFNFKQPVAPRNKDAALRNSWSKPSALIEVGDESAFDVKEVKEEKKPRRRRFSVTERDITLIRFLVRYQFSYIDALARLLDSTPQTVSARLRTLESYDLVKRQRIAQGATLWSARKAGIELVGMNFVENKKEISFATIQHTIGLVNLAVELEREAGGKDILGVENYGESFPVFNRFPAGLRVYSEEELAQVDWQKGEMTVAEREIRQGQKRWRGGRSTAEMRDLVDLAVQSPEGPELEEGNEGLYVVYGNGGKTGEHVPDLVVQRPRQADGAPGHFAIELELTAKSPTDWKRILRSYRDAGHMYQRVYYFTDKRPIANMIRIADEEVGLGPKLVMRKYTPRNKSQPFLG